MCDDNIREICLNFNFSSQLVFYSCLLQLWLEHQLGKEKKNFKYSWKSQNIKFIQYISVYLLHISCPEAQKHLFSYTNRLKEFFQYQDISRILVPSIQRNISLYCSLYFQFSFNQSVLVQKWSSWDNNMYQCFSVMNFTGYEVHGEVLVRGHGVFVTLRLEQFFLYKWKPNVPLQTYSG